MVIIRCFEIAVEIAALASVSSNPKYTLIYAPMCYGAFYSDGWFFLSCRVQLHVRVYFGFELTKVQQFQQQFWSTWWRPYWSKHVV
jgi:hypothetical protein